MDPLNEMFNKINLYPEKSCLVALHGGLGNQLFQWAFGLHLRRFNPDIENVVFLNTSRNNSMAHTQIRFTDYVDTCEHASFRHLDLRLGKLRRFLNDPLEERNVFNQFFGKIENVTDKPFVIPRSETRKNVFYGYFQNGQMVDEISDHILPELCAAFEKYDNSPKEESLYGRAIIHVRRGDFLLTSNAQRIGVMSESFYRHVSGLLDVKPFILTDDITEASRIADLLNVTEIYGPESFDAFQTLRIMARSSTLFSANSTLSWWGGLIASRGGARVFLPSPFFRDIDGLKDTSFAIEGAILLPSSFEEI